jgi:hypothetical protein
MKRLVRLLLLVAWLAGAVAGGYTVDPVPSGRQAGHVLVQTDWAGLTTTGDRVVLVVGRGENAWRVAAPVPLFLEQWLRGLDERRAGAPSRAPIRSAAAILP